jgi:hypothetical protein
MTDNAILDSTVQLPKHVVYRTFAFESVVLNLESGKYHGLNPVAGRMLETLERTPKVRDAAAKLAGEFGRPQEEIEQDLATFCRDLLERGLIELDHGDG